MYPQRQRGKIQHKVSTMPRQQTEAAQYLDLYKLTIEKKRLAQELAGIEQRRQQIYTRMADLEKLVDSLESKAQSMRTSLDQSETPAEPKHRPKIDSNPAKETFDTMFLEY